MTFWKYILNEINILHSQANLVCLPFVRICNFVEGTKNY